MSSCTLSPRYSTRHLRVMSLFFTTEACGSYSGSLDQEFKPIKPCCKQNTNPDLLCSSRWMYYLTLLLLNHLTLTFTSSINTLLRRCPTTPPLSWIVPRNLGVYLSSWDRNVDSRGIVLHPSELSFICVARFGFWLTILKTIWKSHHIM